MKQILKTFGVFSIALIFSTFGMIDHASATPVTEHTHIEHETVLSTNCATICLSTPADKKHELPIYDEEEDEPKAPYYLKFESARTSWFAEKSIAARSIEEPGKIPKYRLCCVIRR